MWRRPEPGFSAVDLKTGSSAADEAKIADNLILTDAFEDERGQRIEAIGLAVIAAGPIEPHRNEADPIKYSHFSSMKHI
tara:strand:- start:3 stop:239 length:237 start_codon:yes stop_codon:yes gene_type:complete